MKTLFSEHQVNYSTYTFSYGVYCVKETQQEIPQIYSRGFLPYTGDIKIKKEVFYLARSVRINLEKFNNTSENRRVNRIAEELAIHVVPVKKEQFNFKDKNFQLFCQRFAEQRFDGGRMDDKRINYIFNQNTISHVLIFQAIEKIYGYVFAAIHGEMLHYWYSFFDIAYLKSHSLGKWMMWRTIQWAKEQGSNFVYLGTCYRAKALYKVRDFNGVEFFDGVKWNDDLKLLKFLCKRDDSCGSESNDQLKSKDEMIRTIFEKLFKEEK